MSQKEQTFAKNLVFPGWLLSESKEILKQVDTSQSKNECVYFIVAENGLVKIGKTNNLQRRLEGLQYMSPVKLELIHLIPCEHFSATRIERDLHIYFAKLRQHGEWLKINRIARKQIQAFNEFDVRQLMLLTEPQSNAPNIPVGNRPDPDNDWRYWRRRYGTKKEK